MVRSATPGFDFWSPTVTMGAAFWKRLIPLLGCPTPILQNLFLFMYTLPMCRRCALIIMLPSDVGDAQTASRSLTSPNPKPNCVISIRFRWFRVTTHHNPSREFSWQEFFSTQTHQTLLTYLQGMKHDIRKNLCNPCTSFETLHSTSILMIAYSQVQHHLH